MRVLILSPFGAAVNPYINLFAQGLQRAGVDVTVDRQLETRLLSSRERPDVIHLHWIESYDMPPLVKPRSPLSLMQRIERVALRRLNAGPIYQARRWRRLKRLLDSLAAFQAAGGRVAYTVHNLDPHEAGRWAEPWALRRIVQRADMLHVHDASTVEAIARDYDRHGRVVVIPHGHYIDAYANSISRSEARQRLNLPQDAFVYACLGLMRPYKGLEELLPAFRETSGDRLRLVVAGRPPDAGYVERLRALAGDDLRILIEPRFIPVGEVQVFLNAADMAVLPYRQITTSGAALLAFSFGLPVVAPAIGAFPNLVTPERGVLYAPGELREALARGYQVAWQPDTRERMMGWVRQFDWAEIGRLLLAAYEETVTSRNTRA